MPGTLSRFHPGSAHRVMIALIIVCVLRPALVATAPDHRIPPAS